MVDNRRAIKRYVMCGHRKNDSKKNLQNVRPYQKYIYWKNGRIDKQKCADCLLFYLSTKSIFYKYIEQSIMLYSL